MKGMNRWRYLGARKQPSVCPSEQPPDKGKLMYKTAENDKLAIGHEEDNIDKTKQWIDGVGKWAREMEQSIANA